MALLQWKIVQFLEEVIHYYHVAVLAAVFLVLALISAYGIYYVISSCFASLLDYLRARSSATVEVPPVTQPVQVGEITEEELKQYDGSDPQKPLLMAIKHQIYDVTQNRMYYGPGGPYALFAGKDASQALAKMSFEEKDLTWDISGLSPFELDALQDWEDKFMSNYAKVGTVEVTGSKAQITSVSEHAETSDKHAHLTKQETIVVDKNDQTSVSGVYSDIEAGLIVKV
ncbi:Membrane steroid-binding protein 1 [Raphanus sativus]|nr:Membrane steroid-binding protein 1 [Raphanus sativus]